MNNAQMIIDGLLSSYVQQYEIPGEAQFILERLRERLSASADVTGELSSLYRAEHCDELALGLLWVAERAGQDPGRESALPDEEQAVHTGVTTALSGLGFLQDAAAGGDGGTEGEIVAEAEESYIQPEETPLPEAEEVLPIEPEPIPEPPEEVPEPVQPTGDGGGTTDLAEIGSLLEQLLEALQAGEETRAGFLVSLRSSFTAVLDDGATEPALRRYAEAVNDFLAYVQDNDLLDDVRVMNFFTNVQEPYAQWLSTPEDAREGILEQAIDFLSDFRAMFE